MRNELYLKERQQAVEKARECYIQARNILNEYTNVVFNAYPLIITETLENPPGEHGVELCITFSIVLNELCKNVSLRGAEVELLTRKLTTWLEENKEVVEEVREERDEKSR